MKKTLLFRVALLSLSLFLAKALAAQNVGINDDNSNPDPNAMLDVKSTSKGVLFPRMTTAQRTVLGSANPTEGMLVYDTDEKAYFFFVGGAWVELAAGGTSGGSVPVGTILSYAGHVNDSIYDGKPAVVLLEEVPGYLLCNGAEIDSMVYPKLARVIKDHWGNGSDGDSETMNLPDLRGMFLRGVSGLRNDGKESPDGREEMLIGAGGNTGNEVGSYQNDALQDHFHGYVRNETTIQRGTSGGQATVLRGTELANSYGPSGRVGSETRPRNAYVHYIIKY